MSGLRNQRDEALLRRLSTFKQLDNNFASLIGPDLVGLHDEAQKRQKKMGKVLDVWIQLVPESLNDHCFIDGFARGTLTVLVDSSAHLYDLKQLLLSGLEKQILLACKSTGLRKIALKPGRGPAL